MINEKERQAVTLSPTKKDFYQIWNELLEVAGKISERWDPTSTNESDPGIVLLKVLTAIADKLNYNIDKNTLEAFMPSAAQEESMRKLCEMLGYDMKYYRSATTKVLLSWISSEPLGDKGAIIDCFSNIKDADDTINYVTTEAVYLGGGDITSVEIPCIEGELVECETDSDNIISVNLLDDNYRYYLPERQIAENGIFITNIADTAESTFWTKVDNLNTHPLKQQIFKFGFDSSVNLPYIQFPSDISTIIEDGLRIRYIRTHGVNGNISARTLSKLERPISWATKNTSEESENEIDADDQYDENNYSAINYSAATNGRNPETLKQAYNNYKKTIGTFDTLVTCRDYMNKIYQLTIDDIDTTPLVSNIIVSDIRDDINRAVTICSFNDYGICYLDSAVKTGDTNQKDRINHFDLVLYPFKTYNNLGTASDYNGSFTYNSAVINEIINNETLNECKTIAHNFTEPETLGEPDIVCIKNYLRLKAKITTTRKVNAAEEKDIRKSIFKAIYNTFNLRELDFGEEIPFDDILACIEDSDNRIKNVALEEPVLYTKLLLANGDEKEIVDAGNPSDLWRKLAVRNILAGRVPLFSYNDTFSYDYTETNSKMFGKDITHVIEQLEPIYTPPTDSESSPYYYENIKLGENEVIKFRAPNFKTVTTYPAYVNYFAQLNNTTGKGAIPATFKLLKDFMTNSMWETIANGTDTETYLDISNYSVNTEPAFIDAKNKYIKLFKKNTTTNKYELYEGEYVSGSYNYAPLISSTFGTWVRFIKNQIINGITLAGLFRWVSSDASRNYGKLIDNSNNVFNYANKYLNYNITATEGTTAIYVQETHGDEVEGQNGHTKDGLGRNAQFIGADGEYQLGEGEFLILNYTTSDDSNTKYIHNVVYLPGDIIKPNFELLDTITEAQQTSRTYTKTEVDTTVNRTKGNSKNPSDYTNVPTVVNGMFTLGPNDQIEIREKVEITLDKAYTNIYWNLQKEEVVNGVINFFETNAASRVLKDGEYFYYTDANKAEFAYYGSGTEIKRSNIARQISKLAEDTEVSTKDIAEKGLLAGIPWRSYDFNNDDKLIISEYQYKTLTSGDTLDSLVTEDTPESSGKVNSGKWSKVNDASYTSDTKQILPTIKVKDVITGEPITWEVTSILNINAGPNTPQVLGNNDKIILKYTGGSTKEIPETGDGHTIKTNYDCIASQDIIDTSITQYVDDTPVAINDFRMKVYDHISGDELAKYYNNFGNNLTRLSIDQFKPGYVADEPDKTVELNLNIHITEDTKTALLMLYQAGGDNETIAKNAYIYAADANHVEPKLSLYNYSGTNGWWPSYKIDNHYYLKHNQIHIINLPIYKQDESRYDEYTLKLCYTFHKEQSEDVYASSNINLIFSGVDLVTGVNAHIGIGTSLDITTGGGTLTNFGNLLQDISKLDANNNFYYNNVTDKSMLIDFNTNVVSGTSETLLDPNSWYNYNNINNKFVVSQIDTNYMLDGIVLTKSSKL